MTLTQLYLEAAASHLPGLSNTPVATLTDADIRGIFATIRTHLECEITTEIAEMFRSHGSERALSRFVVQRMLPAAREAIRIARAAFSVACAAHRARLAVAAE